MSALRPDEDLQASAAPAPEAAPQLDRQARALIARIRKNWNDVEAIRALGAHYTKSADYASLANLMEGWGDALQEPRASADAYVEAADALLLSGHGQTGARLLYERALSRDASHVQALDRLTRLLDEAKDFERMKQVLKYVAYRLEQANGNRQLLASVHYRLGEVYETHFDEPRKAATLYRKAIDENPRLITAISAARRLFLENGNHKTVSVLYEFEIEATPNAEDKHNLLIAQARHKREACDDLDGAVLAFRRASKLIPNSLRALFGLAETLLARSERGESLARDTDRQRAAEVFVHLARSVPASDALPYLQRALLVVPEHPDARGMLEALNRDTPEPRASEPRPRTETGPPPDSEARSRAASEPQIEPAQRTAEGARAAAEAWLKEDDLQPGLDELTTGELILVDDGEPVSGRPAQAPASLRAPSRPPQTLEAPAPPRPAPPRAGPPRAAPPRPKPASPPRPPATLPEDRSRMALEVNVGNTTDSNFYVDASESLVDGGVYVATYSPLPVGTAVRLTITLPGRLIAYAHGRVTLTRDLMDAFDDHIPGMCVEFEAIDPASLRLIGTFALRRAPMYIEP